MLGPKPAQRLLSDLTQGKLDTATPALVSNFVAGARVLRVRDAWECGCTWMLPLCGTLPHRAAVIYCFLLCPRVAELRELVDEVMAERRLGNVHEEAEAVTAVLIELRVRGKHLPLPESILHSLPDMSGPKSPKAKRRGSSSQAEPPKTLADLAKVWVDNLENNRRERKAVAHYYTELVGCDCRCARSCAA